MTEPVNIRAVAFKEGDVWIVQGLEYDIVSRGSSMQDVFVAFERAVVETACISQSLGRKPFEGIGRAPEEFFEKFESAQSMEINSIKPLNADGVESVAVRPLCAA